MTNAPATLKAGEDGWTAWSGGPRPHAPNTVLEVRLRNGTVMKLTSAFARWRHDEDEPEQDIIAFRPVSAPPAVVAGKAGDWSDWPRKARDARYEINGRPEWEAPCCPFCANIIDPTSDVTIIGGEGLALAHTACLPEEAALTPAPDGVGGQDLGASAAPIPTGALADIAAERQRQVQQEGWTPEHDDTHSRGEMARAAACYSLSSVHIPITRPAYIGEAIRHCWPWDQEWWKPKGARVDLVRAAALIVAEIERLDRRQSPRHSERR